MLTAAQERAKMKAENNGQVFMPPSQYKAMMQDRAKPKYSKKAVKVNPQQVASYSARKAYKSDFKEISPDTDMLIDQVLNPEDVNEIIRWPNTYGLSAVYKCKTVINARFAEDGRCCVVTNPTIRDSIFTTFGAESIQTLAPYSSVGNSQNPFAFQSVVLASPGDVINFSAPFILPNRQAILPVPNAQTGTLLYPFACTIPLASTTPVRISFRLPNALADQASIRLSVYDADFQEIRSSAANIGPTTNPSSLGVDLNLVLTTDVIAAAYFSIIISGTQFPFYGPVYGFVNHPETVVANRATFIAPNHSQHVVIYDIKDADTIAESADQAFVLSQSLLITSEMSDLQNGGVLAIARIPAASVVGESSDTIDSSSWYDWIASLSYNNYDGAVKNGGYAFYLPEDETGFFYRPLDSYFDKELPFIVSEFTTSDPNPLAITVRIKVSSIVQFTTTSAVYDCRPSCYVSEMAFMHHVLSLVSAAYSNDGHKGGLKAGLKKVGAQVVKLLKNPKTYTTVAQLIKGLGAAII